MWIVVVASALFASPLEAQGKIEKSPADLIKDLGSPEFKTRDAASRK
jgi:hypothetical protein